MNRRSRMSQPPRRERGAVLLIGSAVRGLGPVGYQQALDQGVPQLDVPSDEWHHLTGL